MSEGDAWAIIGSGAAIVVGVMAGAVWFAIGAGAVFVLCVFALISTAGSPPSISSDELSRLEKGLEELSRSLDGY